MLIVIYVGISSFTPLDRIITLCYHEYILFISIPWLWLVIVIIITCPERSLAIGM